MLGLESGIASKLSGRGGVTRAQPDKPTPTVKVSKRAVKLWNEAFWLEHRFVSAISNGFACVFLHVLPHQAVSPLLTGFVRGHILGVVIEIVYSPHLNL